jgi:hypothetical protein
VVLGTFAVMFVMTAGAGMADPGNGNSNGQDKANGGNRAEHAQSANHQTDGTNGTSGDPAQPQPKSTADDNGTGSNTDGPYDSTRDGSPSVNGNGDGNATGQPCAGCVGKADNKNPAGQLPGPQDANNGYECDGNSGIAKTNPAHTGCMQSTPPVTPPRGEPTGPSGEPTPGTAVLANVVTPQPTAATLPATGSDIASPLAGAAVALMGGVLLLETSRRLQRG